PDLAPARGPRAAAGEVVAHDRHPPVGADVAVLLAPREAVAADLDRITILRDPEADRHDVRRPARIGGGEPPQPLPAKVLELLVIERCHAWILIPEWPAPAAAPRTRRRPTPPESQGRDLDEGRSRRFEPHEGGVNPVHPAQVRLGIALPGLQSRLAPPAVDEHAQ